MGGDFVLLESSNGAVIRQEIDYLIESFNDDGWDYVEAIFEHNEITIKLTGGVASRISDFDSMKDKIIVRMLNYERNKTELEGKVYKRIGDFVIALYVLAFADGKEMYSFKVHEDNIDAWGITEEEAIELGLSNSSSLFPPRVYDVNHLFGKPEKEAGIYMGKGKDSPNIKLGEFGEDTFTAYGTPNGAVSFFYSGVKERIAEMLDGEDYYVVFSSIGEFHVHKCFSARENSLKMVLDDLNASFPPEEMVTESIYKYSVNSGELTKVT